MSRPYSSRFAVAFVWAITLMAIATPRVQAQTVRPYDPDCIELPVMATLTGAITKPLLPGTAEQFGRSVMPVFAQNGGLPGVVIQRIKADTIARGDYSLESYFYRGTAGRFPDSSDRQRIGISEIGSEGRLLCAGDWDGDGYRDLAMWLRLYKDSTFGGQEYRPGHVVIFWGNEREQYSLEDTSRLIGLTEQWGIAFTASNKDLDGDSIQDLFLFARGGMEDGIPLPTAQLHIFRGVQGKRWGRDRHTRTAEWALWNLPAYRRLAVVDQNADGVFDIIFHDDQDGRIATLSVLYGRRGAFPDTTDIETIDLTIANGHYSLFSDVTGDGVPELLVNTGSPELIRIYAGSPGQRLKEQYGSGYEGPTPGKGFWRRPWAEIWLPNKLDNSWRPAGWERLFDLGDVNNDGIDDIWAYSHPYLICYAGGPYLDSLIDAIITVPGTEFISAAPVGDISGTGRPALAVGYDWIPHDYVNPFPGGVRFVRTDTSFTTRQWNPRRLPQTSSQAPLVPVENASGLRLYPNPARESVQLQWESHLTHEGRVSVINLLGEEVASRSVDALTHGTELDLSALPAGSYRVLLKTGTSIRSTVLMKY